MTDIKKEEWDAAVEDAMFYGVGYLVEGKRIDPKDIMVLTTEATGPEMWECDCTPRPSDKGGVFYFCQAEADKGDAGHVVYRRCTGTLVSS